VINMATSGHRRLMPNEHGPRVIPDQIPAVPVRALVELARFLHGGGPPSKGQRFPPDLDAWTCPVPVHHWAASLAHSGPGSEDRSASSRTAHPRDRRLTNRCMITRGK